MAVGSGLVPVSAAPGLLCLANSSPGRNSSSDDEPASPSRAETAGAMAGAGAAAGTGAAVAAGAVAEVEPSGSDMCTKFRPYCQQYDYLCVEVVKKVQISE